MSYNGSGTFNINSTGQPVVAGTVITASAFNALTTDLATGLTTAITKDGQTTTTARITFAQGITSSLTTDSSSVSTGSIITAGGAGIAKNLYVGGALDVAGATTFTNPVINNIKMGYTTTATAAGTTTLTVASNYRQFFTGTSTQTIVLPVTSTLVTGIAYEIENNSTGTLTVNSSGGNLVGTIPAGVCAHAVCIGTTLTTAADWDWDYISTTTITGTGANVLGTSPTIATPTITGDATISGLTVGKGAGAVATNTALGYQALNGNSSGVGLFVAGYQAGLVTTGSYSTFTGYQAGKANTSGENTAYGANVLLQNTTGTANTALGGTTTSISGALASNTTGGSNVGVGVGALSANTTASTNTAVGYQAGYTNTTGAGNVFLGNQTGYSNTASNNTFLGNSAGYAVTSGAKNTIIGQYNGNQGGLDIRTSSNYIVLSDGDGNPKGYFGNTNYGEFTLNASASQAYNGILNFATATTIKAQAYHENSSSQWKFVNGGSGGVYLASGGTSWVSASDERLKDIIEPIENGLTKVASLRAVIGKFKTDAEGTRRSFLIAQDVQAVLPEAISTTMVKDDETNTEYLGVSYTDVIPLLVASIKELKTIVDAQATEITALKAKVGI